jgi:hypothetical protein
MLKGPYTKLSAKLLSPMSVHHRPVEVGGVKVFGRCFSLRNSQISWTVASRNGF